MSQEHIYFCDICYIHSTQCYKKDFKKKLVLDKLELRSLTRVHCKVRIFVLMYVDNGFFSDKGLERDTQVV